MIRRVLTPSNLIKTSLFAAGSSGYCVSMLLLLLLLPLSLSVCCPLPRHPTRSLASLTPRLGIYKLSTVLPTRQISQAVGPTPAKMRAIRVDQFGDEGNLKLVDSKVPTPKENEVLIKIEAIGVNPVEVMIRSGLFGDMIKTPYVPGSDVAGVVQEVGSGVTRVKKGDRVFAIQTSSGAYAEYCTSPADYVSPLHKNLTFNQGAAIGLPYTVAYKSLFIRADAKKGDVVLVHGASGAVGQAAVQMAKASGMTVIGTAGTPEGVQLVKKQGADHVYNHRDKDYMTEIKKATGGKGVNVILEMLANKNLVADLGVVAPRGKIVIIGNKGSIPDFDPSLTMGVEADVMGMVVQVSTHDEYMTMLNALNKGQASWLKPEVAKVYLLDQTPQAHRDITNSDGSKGKLVINPVV